MKKGIFRKMTARAAMTLFALFCFLGGANAQKTLPYEYDFENCWVSTLEADGWSKVDCDAKSGIYAGSSLEGELQFIFEPNNDHDQYLISPELNNNAPIRVLFYYQSLQYKQYATFEFGYSTTTSDVGAFTWVEEVSAIGTWNGAWKQYENVIPADSKFVAIKYTYTSNDYQLCLDDFRFVKATGNYGTWLVSYGSDNTAIIDVLKNQLGIEQTPAEALVDAAPCYLQKGVSEEEAKDLAIPLIANGAIAYPKDMTKHEGYATWLVSRGDNFLDVVRTLREKLGLGLKAAKDLSDAAPCMVLETLSEEEAQALADALIANGATVYVEDLSGKTKPLPYTYGFENGNLEGEGWSLVDCYEGTQIWNYSHEGNYSFRFNYNSNPPQYLISPKLQGATGIAVSFYYHNTSDDYPETFQVGYSTTTDSPDAFTWRNEVTANDQTTWKQYKTTFPKGTKYVAIKHTSYDMFCLFFDDFCFEEVKPKPLPYTYSFENNDLEGEGWSLVDCEANTKIQSEYTHEGNYGFSFRYTFNPPQYLISPQLEGTTSVAVSFYYKNQNNNYPETFQVGYSTTGNSPDAFTWGSEMTANDKTTWKQYKATFPEGTKYVAVKYTSNDKHHLILDDFCFEEAKPKPLPYTYGFENNDLEGEGWSLVDCDEDSEIYNNEVLSNVDCPAYEGDNCFIFSFNSNPPQYLISPQLEGTTGVAVSFYYTILNEGYPETFQVGYSTTTNSPDAFKWGNEVTANDKTTWKQYKATFPEGTKYVAVKYTSNNQFYLFLDDFCFEEATAIPGDVNGDGSVNISDVTALVNIILGKGTDENGTADVNNDGSVNISDVTALVNIILGK